MKQAITALVVQVEITQYDDAGKVTGRIFQDGKMPSFVVHEASIPDAVLEWVQSMLKKNGG